MNQRFCVPLSVLRYYHASFFTFQICMAKYVVATLNEISPGERKIVEVMGRSIGVFNIAGEFCALLAARLVER